MINVWIDKFTPCLKDVSTGELVETEVIRIKRSSFLSKYNKKSGWYVNWEALLKENEIYALVTRGSVDIQGLVAVYNFKESGTAFISWMCVSPENNPLISDPKRYEGVGGHLFVIAVQKSVDYGHEGRIMGFAANKELLNHYIEVFHAEHIGTLHEYHIGIFEDDMKACFPSLGIA